MTQRRDYSEPSLNDELQLAASEREIQDLLHKGQSFQHVSNRTRNRWDRTAKRRLVELRNENGSQ